MTIPMDRVHTEYSYHLVNVNNSFIKETEAFRN